MAKNKTPQTPDWARTIAHFLTADWRKQDVNGEEMELYFTDAQHWAYIAASTAWQQMGMNEDAFWSKFFAELLPCFPEISTREACRRFRIPPANWPTETLQALADATAKQEAARLAAEEASDAVMAAEAQQAEYKRTLKLQRDMTNYLAIAKINAAALSQDLADVLSFRAESIYKTRGDVDLPGDQWNAAVIRNYGAEIALRAAIEDAPKQIERIESELAEVGKKVAKFERQLAKATKGAAAA